MKRKKRESGSRKLKYQPTAQERSAVGDNYLRRAADTAPRIKVLGDGKAAKISVHHPDEAIGFVLLMEALGTADPDFASGLLDQLANLDSKDGQINERRLNFLLSVIKGIKPRDQLEAMLAAQMAAVHMTTMSFARHFKSIETLYQQDSADRAFNKLTRTYLSQMEALKRYRTGGEQKVTVQHVSVGEGGQAIVGNVTQTPPKDSADKAAPAPPALTDARATPMPPIAESKERFAVPARRKSREK